MGNSIEGIGAIGIEWQGQILTWFNPKLQAALAAYESKNTVVELIPGLMQVPILDFLCITLGACLVIWILLRNLM